MVTELLELLFLRDEEQTIFSFDGLLKPGGEEEAVGSFGSSLATVSQARLGEVGGFSGVERGVGEEGGG